MNDNNNRDKIRKNNYYIILGRGKSIDEIFIISRDEMLHF